MNKIVLDTSGNKDHILYPLKISVNEKGWFTNPIFAYLNQNGNLSLKDPSFKNQVEQIFNKMRLALSVVGFYQEDLTEIEVFVDPKIQEETIKEITNKCSGHADINRKILRKNFKKGILVEISFMGKN